MKWLFSWVRWAFGWTSVPEVCEWSKGKRDYHDYHEHKGGDGHPCHFTEYECWNCGKKFWI